MNSTSRGFISRLEVSELGSIPSALKALESGDLNSGQLGDAKRIVTISLTLACVRVHFALNQKLPLKLTLQIRHTKSAVGVRRLLVLSPLP